MTKKPKPPAKTRPSAPGRKPSPAPNALLKKWPWVLAFALIFSLHLTNVSSEFGGGLGGDHAVYYLLAKALATGQGYVDLYLPGHPAHTVYPFLFPLLLAPAQLLFRDPLPAMHAVVIFFNAAAAVLLGAWCGKRVGSEVLGLLFAFMFGTLPKVYGASQDLLSEPVFLALVYGALLFSAEEEAENLSARRFFALALLVVAAYFTRTVGLVLALALALELGRRRTRATLRGYTFPAWAGLAVVFIVCALIWGLRNRVTGGPSFAYTTELFLKDPYHLEAGKIGATDFFGRVFENVRYYVPLLIGGSFVPAVLWRAPTIAALCLFAVMIAGIVRDARRSRLAAESFWLGSFAIALLWNYQEARFVFPLLGLGAFFLFRGLTWPVAKFRGEAWESRAMTGLLIAALIGNGIFLRTLVANRFRDFILPSQPVSVPGYGSWEKPVINWAKYDYTWWGNQAAIKKIIYARTDYIIINRVAAQKVPQDAVILSRLPMCTYDWSGRAAVPLRNDPSPEAQWEYLQQQRVAFIVIGEGETILQPLFDQWPERFEVTARVTDSNAQLIKILAPE